MLHEKPLVEEIKLDGFQVVRSHYFSHAIDPCMTLFKTAIGFNLQAIEALHNCDKISVLVNEETRCILISPVLSNEPDGISWRKAKKSYNKTECASFGRYLFETWHLNEQYRYRTRGRLVQADKKVMLLFDFSHPEIWNGKDLVKEDGK